MNLQDIDVILFAICIYYFLRYIVIKLWNRWSVVMLFLHPETQQFYIIKERKGKYRYYVNYIRVPEKLYNWL